MLLEFYELGKLELWLKWKDFLFESPDDTDLTCGSLNYLQGYSANTGKPRNNHQFTAAHSQKFH